MDNWRKETDLGFRDVIQLNFKLSERADIIAYFSDNYEYQIFLNSRRLAGRWSTKVVCFARFLRQVNTWSADHCEKFCSFHCSILGHYAH